MVTPEHPDRTWRKRTLQRLARTGSSSPAEAERGSSRGVGPSIGRGTCAEAPSAAARGSHGCLALTVRSCGSLIDRGRSRGSLTWTLLSFRAPPGTRARRTPVRVATPQLVEPSTHGSTRVAPPPTSPRASTPTGQAPLRPAAATRPVPFRPRGFAPPRRLSPHAAREPKPAASRGSQAPEGNPARPGVNRRPTRQAEAVAHPNRVWCSCLRASNRPHRIRSRKPHPSMRLPTTPPAAAQNNARRHPEGQRAQERTPKNSDPDTRVSPRSLQDACHEPDTEQGPGSGNPRANLGSRDPDRPGPRDLQIPGGFEPPSPRWPHSETPGAVGSHPRRSSSCDAPNPGPGIPTSARPAGREKSPGRRRAAVPMEPRRPNAHGVPPSRHRPPPTRPAVAPRADLTIRATGPLEPLDSAVHRRDRGFASERLVPRLRPSDPADPS